jgi:hypothetical protein
MTHLAARVSAAPATARARSAGRSATNGIRSVRGVRGAVVSRTPRRERPASSKPCCVSVSQAHEGSHAPGSQQRGWTGQERYNSGVGEPGSKGSRAVVRVGLLGSYSGGWW